MKVKDPADLKRFRKGKNLSQRDLAYLVRRSQTTIYLLESGQMETLSEDLAVSIAARLGEPWDKLFSDHETIFLPNVTNGQTVTGHSRKSA